MNDVLQPVTQYILDPDDRGNHLKQMAEHIAARWLASSRASMRAGWGSYLEEAAETVAGFIHLVWGDAGPGEYAPRTYEMLCALRDRVRGMDPASTWEYAIDALTTDIQVRLVRAAKMALDPELETAMVHHFFDSLDEFEYLHDVARHIMELHWRRRHSPDSAGASAHGPIGPRGEEVLETHLHRVAMESLATYIEQSNIARGNIDRPTDAVIVLRDRIEIQLKLGGKSAATWSASGRELADRIESRLGTAAGRRQARLARGRWKALMHAQANEA